MDQTATWAVEAVGRGHKERWDGITSEEDARARVEAERGKAKWERVTLLLGERVVAAYGGGARVASA